MTDGLVISKGKRLPRSDARNDLRATASDLRSFIHNPDHAVRERHQLTRAAPIDYADESLELVPEVYLEQAEPSHEEIVGQLQQSVRDVLSYLIKINRIDIRAEMLTKQYRYTTAPHA